MVPLASHNPPLCYACPTGCAGRRIVPAQRLNITPSLDYAKRLRRHDSVAVVERKRPPGTEWFNCLKAKASIELRFYFLFVLVPRVIYQLIAKDHSVISIMRSAYEFYRQGLAGYSVSATTVTGCDE